MIQFILTSINVYFIKGEIMYSTRLYSWYFSREGDFPHGKATFKDTNYVKKVNNLISMVGSSVAQLLN